MSFLFFLLKITNKICYSVLMTIDDFINFKIHLRSTSKQSPTGKKKGKTEIQKLEYLEKVKSFLDEIKGIFHNYLRVTI